MKLSDYVAEFLAAQGIRHVFGIIGGASLHLVDSLAKTPGTTIICPQHEQAGSMAADAYARVTGNLGAAIATSGPGATNMITGVCCAYYDSVPVIFITGQAASHRNRADTGVRQVGFQETPTVEMFRPVTKYAVLVEDPQEIRYELEKAVHIAKSGRPGPVLVDIRDDHQRTDIDPDKLRSFVPDIEKNGSSALDDQVSKCIDLINQAKRPVVITGWGIRLSGSEEKTRKFIEKLGFPVLPTWAMMDFMPSDHPLVVGTFGTHGTRYANFAVQNSDLVLALGTRLDTHGAGSPLGDFARGAKKIVVDIDETELNKFKRFGMDVDLPIHADVKDLVKALNSRSNEIRTTDFSEWGEQIAEWKTRYPICPASNYEEEDVNPYVLIKTLSEESSEGDTFFVDTGCAVAWTMQAFDVKPNQRVFHDFNNTAMGYALPASIGASLALDNKPVICIVGDGSLQMNLQELATVLRHDLPIKIFVINNHGYSMVRQTQDQWLDGRYFGTNVEGGLAFPDFIELAKAYGYKTVNIERNADIRENIRKVLDSPGSVFCNVEIRPDHGVIPQYKFGRPIEDTEPLLDRQEFFANMIVEPLEVSRTDE